jgi:hypothetical protein
VSTASAAIAANDAEVALAWVQNSLTDGHLVLGFARLDSGLDVISTSQLEESALQASYASAEMAMAPSLTGWIVAVFAGPELFLRALDTDGRDLGRTTVDSIPQEDVFLGLTIAPRPGGGALLLWRTQKGAREVVISDDGLSTTSPKDLSWPDTNITSASAAYLSDTFYVAFLDPIDDTHTQLYLQGVAVDGTPAAPRAVPGDPSAGMLQLASGANDLRVVYSSYKPASAPIARYDIGLERFDGNGQVLASSTPIGQVDYWAASALAFGDDTVALLQGSDPDAVAITRIDSAGNVVTPVSQIATWTQPALVSTAMVRRGPDVVVTWMSILSGGIRIARVQP